MSHHTTRHASAKRMYVEPQLFGYSDAEIARLDQEQEDRRNSYRERPACKHCLNRGCPDCWGLGELDGEYDEQEDES